MGVHYLEYHVYSYLLYVYNDSSVRLQLYYFFIHELSIGVP